MSDSRKSQNKKISISTISDEVDAQTSNQLNSHEQSSSHFHSTQNDVSSSSHVDFNQSSSSNHNSNDNNGHNSNRQSLKRQSRRSRPSSNEQESITLQETERRPVTLKASFLRRKIKEYEDEDDATTSGATLEDAGKRVIFINQQQPQKYCNNHISTAKYSALSFIPSFLFEQFRRYSNCFFLFIALLQQIPDVSPTGRYTTLVPLIFILSVSAIKEIIEDFKRHRADDETNNREIEKLQNGLWVNVKWRHLAVGDIVKVQNNNFFPADLILLSSSEPQGISFIETSNLDGETNLKIRQGLPDTSKIVEAKDLNQLQGTIESEPPNRHLYEFNGNFKELNRQVQALGPDQVLLRGAMLRNTSWIFGMVIYTGHDTKLMRNSTSAPLKRSTVDKMTNTQILMLFFILIVLCLTSAIFNEIWTLNYFTDHWYLGTKNWTKNFAYNLLTFIILYNNLIPISLQVTLELVRFIQAIFINLDIEMYHEESNTPAMARTSNLNEELGMVKYVFSDKTGTLTRNVMEFKKCSIAGQIYALENEAEETGEISSTSFTTTDGPGPSRLSQHILAEKSDSDVARNFMTLMAICHTVIPENGSSTAHDNVDNASSINVINEDIIYHAASPDERALVYGAKKFGFIFHTRTPAYVEMDALGDTERYDILNVLEFTSTRKRMSIIARNSRGEIKLYCKGADTVIFERLAPDGQDYKDITLRHLEEFASEGLRTLCLAVADIDPEVYEHWKDTYHKASTAIQNRERKVEDAASLIEINLKLLGATAIEDKLQEGVPETIAALLEAKIKLWVLTGDKQETAINIGYSCRLLQQGMDLIIMNEDSLDNTRTSINRHSHDFQAVTSSCSSANNEHFKKDNTALIIDGKTLKYALSCELRREFYELCINCKCVICCRVSPIQKADCIMLVRECSKSKDLWSRNDCVTLAIGDGANDVAMIQRAHVGVGISGVEGLQAACASDYSIAQFKYLRKLLLVHGAWNYSRMCKLILYSFYKNICLYVIELWFAIYSGWSGQILFERWTIGLYNVFFTALPPFAIGIFDKVYSADTLFRNPKIYENFQSARLFNVKVFWIWIGNALIHSIILYWMPMYSYFDGIVWDNGREGGYLVLGNMVYTYVVVTVCLKAGLISNSWTWLTHCAIWGSIALWFLFMLIYSNIWPIIRVGAVFSGMHHMIFTTPAFWFGLFLIPVAALLLDVVIKVIQNRHKTGTTYTPRSSQPRQESKASFLWTLYSNDSNQLIIKNDFFKILQNEITYQNRERNSQNENHLTINTLSLFGNSLTSVTFDQFRSWILMHKDATIFSKWLLLDSSISLTSNNEAPTFYQSLAGVTHLEEKDICDLEKRFWQLKSFSLNGQLDLELLSQLLSPLFPTAAINGLFAAFDENCDGHIDFKELCCGISQSTRSPDVERIKFCFKVFDFDRDNTLNNSELEHMINVILDITAKCTMNVLKNVTFEKVLSDVKEFVGRNEKWCNTNQISESLAISQEDFLMWCVQSEINITQPLTDLLFEICHVIFGLRPQCKHLELCIVKGWLSREKLHGYEIGQFWYLVSADWWQKWLLYTTSNTQSTTVSPCSYCKSITTRPAIEYEYDESWNTSNLSESLNNSTDIGDSLSLSSGSSSTSLTRGSPGIIENMPLLAMNPYKHVPSLTGEGGKLKKEIPLVQHRDFELLPEKLYKALKSWYESTLDLPRQVIKPSSTEVLEIELYPVNLKIFKHQQPQQNSNQTSNHTNTWNTISSGYGALATSGYSSVSSQSNSTPKKYLAYLAAFSRLATVRQVTEFLCIRLKLKPDTVRIWHIPQNIDASYVLLEDETLSLEELGITDDNQILLELRNKDLTWPEEIQYLKISQNQTLVQDRRGTVASVQSFYALGVCGLHNLGNTCFMNAALQVLFNTKPLTEYFKQNLHLFELNIHNKMSTKGHLTMRYAELLKEILSAQTRSIAPIKFRFSVSKFAPQFTNGMQHDSQELLAWLLDTLHEDLNRVTEKPYIEIKDSNGRSDQLVAKEAYDAFLKRNNSVIVDLFYGQMKSKVACLTCNTESVRFEPFSLLSLPLPLENFVLCEVLLTKLNGEFPTKYAAKLNSDCKYWDLKNHLSELSNLEAASILICQVDSSQIKYIFTNDQKIISSSALNLYAYELPKIQEVEKTVVEKEVVGNNLKDIQRQKENGSSSKMNGNSTDNKKSQDNEKSVKHSIDILGTSPMNSFMTPPNDIYDMNVISSTESIIAEKSTTLLNEQMNAVPTSKINTFENEEDNTSLSSFRDKQNFKCYDFQCNYLIALHRKFTRQDTYFLSYHKTKPSLFGVPLLVPFTNDMKNRDLYFNVWVQVSKFLSPLPKAPRDQFNHAEDCDDSMGYDFPFILSTVNENGLVCALCPWEKFCRGCNIPCNDQKLLEEIHHFNDAYNPSAREIQNSLQKIIVQKLIYIAIDWDTSALHLRYQSTREKVFNEHESVAINRKLLAEPVDLNNCLRAFTSEEKLDENIHCSHCKSKQPATKKLQLWKLPPILIIHLKRFNLVNNKWVKSQKVVNFPLDNFDPTLFLASIPQETIFRHRELHELKAKNIKNVDCNEEIKEFDLENDIPNPNKTDCDKTSKTDAQEENEGINELCSSKDINRGFKPARQRLISTSLTKTPVVDHELIDYNNHKLTENSDPFDLKYKLYAVISHSGMLSGGHYISYASNANNKSWYCFNDSSCREISSTTPNIDPSSAYLLFYERKNLDYLPYLPKIENKQPLLNHHSELLEENDNDLKKMCVLS